MSQKLAPGPKGGLPPWKEGEEIDLRIAHWSLWGPRRSGMYETVRELIGAEMQIEGVLPAMCVVPPQGSSKRQRNKYVQGGFVDPMFPQLRTQDWGWAYKWADIHVIHFTFDKRLGKMKPKAFFMHGCFHRLQRIRMADGSMKPIKDVREGDLVLSYNFEEQRVEVKPVTWAGINGMSDSGKRIRFRHGPDGFPTDDHPYYLADGSEVHAEGLRVGDECLASKPVLSSVQREIVLGSLLGDGCLAGSSLAFSHKKEHQDYNETLLHFFEGFNLWEGEAVSGFETEMSRARISLRQGQVGRSSRGPPDASLNPFNEIREICYPNGEKEITHRWLEALTWRSLAVLYLDDGSLQKQKYEKQNGETSVYETTVILHTNRYSYEEVEALSQHLETFFDLPNKVTPHSGYPQIHIYEEQARDHFFKEICRAFPIPDVMAYKIPEKYHRIPCPITSDRLHFTTFLNEVIEITDTPPFKPSQPQETFTRHALEVKDNHNYFAGLTLVSNTLEAVVQSALKETDDARALLSAADWVNKFEATFVVNRRTEEFMRVFDPTGSKVHRVPKGIDLSWWTRANTVRDLEGEPSVLFGEVWRGIKHPAHLLYAMNLLYEENQDARLNTWGLASHRDFWEYFLGAADFWRFMGQDRIPGIVDYPDKFYSRGDVLVSPVQAGDVSRVAQESMACGCPVVAWDTDPYQENHPWKYADAFNIHELKDKITETYNEVLDNRQAVAAECRRIAEKHFDIRDEARRVVRVLRRVVNES